MDDSNKDNLSQGGGMSRPRNNFLAQPKLLKASMLNNPFRKTESDTADNFESNNLFASIISGHSDNTTDDKNSKDENSKNNDDIVPKFVPLHSARGGISFAGGNNKVLPHNAFSKATNFIFGQNLKERIINSPDNAGGSSNENSSSESTSTNGTSASLFSAVIQASADSQTAPKTDTNTLEESAQTWERIRESSQLNLPPQQVVTGEEDERNQLQMNCRLFTFESGNWKERGRGQLRLNDGDGGSSRVVCRAAGSLRIMLNTKIWGEMVVERPGQKSLRITATDPQQQLKLFLIMASPDEITLLHKAISRRVVEAQKMEKSDRSKADNSASSENDTSMDNLNNSFSIEKKSNNGYDGNRSNTSESEESSSRSAETPKVVVSSEEDGSTSIRDSLKRAKSSDESSTPKKICMELPPVDDDTL